jgi:chemotaxis signal transduction protein
MLSCSSVAHRIRMNSPDSHLDSATPDEPQLRDLFSFRAGGRTFAVFADDVEGTADLKQVAPLPHAPAAVLGVLCVRGRMLTTLDPLALITGERLLWPTVLPCVIALRGDEQIALAAESFGNTITLFDSDIEAAPPELTHGALAGISIHGGEEITIFSVPNLFLAAFQRPERRRRRF